MSALETLNRTNFKQNLELAVVEVAIYNWINGVLDDLRSKLKRNQINPDEARQVWKVKRACYECCSKAAREGKLFE